MRYRKDVNVQVVKGGIGFLPALALLFIALKLMHFIDWSWWVVLSPIWAPVAVVGVIILAYLVYSLITGYRK